MRKMQEKLLQRATALGYGPSAVMVLRRQDLTIKQLRDFYDLMYSHRTETFSYEMIFSLSMWLKGMRPYIPDPDRNFGGYKYGISTTSRTIAEMYELLNEIYPWIISGAENPGSFLIWLCLPRYDYKCAKKIYIEISAGYNLSENKVCSILFDNDAKNLDLQSIMKVLKILAVTAEDYDGPSIKEAVQFAEYDIPDEILEIGHYNYHNVAKMIFDKEYPDFSHHLDMINDAMKKVKDKFDLDLYHPFVFDQDVLNELDWTRKNVPDSVDLSTKGVIEEISLFFTLSGFSVKLTAIHGMYINTADVSKTSFLSKGRKSTEYLFFYDGSVKRKYRDRWLPATFKNIAYDIQYFASAKIFINEYKAKMTAKGCYIWNDLDKYLERECSILPPIKLDLISKYPDLNLLMRGEYTRAGFVDWNRCDLTWAFSIMKILPRLNERSRNLLLQKKYDNEKQNFDAVEYIMERLQIGDYDPDGRDDIIFDYVQMSKTLKKRISLNFNSFSKLKEAHDDLAKIITEKNTPLIRIPKNSQFKRLQAKLPGDFEWIKTRKRLVKEGHEMHNCVASYANLINKDKCAIYSAEINGTRYTMEFRSSKKGFHLFQIMGVCNSVPKSEDTQFVQDLLASIT